MNNNNLLQKIGVAIIIIALLIRIGRRFVDGELAEILSYSHYLTLLGAVVWLTGFFIKRNNDKKLN